MTIWHSYRSLQSVGSGLDNFSSLCGVNKVKELDDALRDFRVHFPHAEGVRNSVAHTAELTKSLKALEDNALTADYKSDGVSVPKGTTWLNNFVKEDTFSTTTFGGVEVSFDMTRETYVKLRDLALRALGAFESREAIGARWLNERRSKPKSEPQA